MDTCLHSDSMRISRDSPIPIHIPNSLLSMAGIKWQRVESKSNLPESFDSANCSRTDAASNAVDLMHADGWVAFAAVQLGRAEVVGGVDVIDALPLDFHWHRCHHWTHSNYRPNGPCDLVRIDCTSDYCTHCGGYCCCCHRFACELSYWNCCALNGWVAKRCADSNWYRGEHRCADGGDVVKRVDVAWPTTSATNAIVIDAFAVISIPS